MRAPTQDPLNHDDVVYVASIADHEIIRDLSLVGSYAFPATDGNTPFVLPVYGRMEYYDLGDDRKGQNYNAAKDIARDIINAHNPSANYANFGLFLCAKAQPNEEEISKAREVIHAFDLEQVNKADIDYARFPNRPDYITDVQRRAAKRLGLSREWLIIVRETQECPACGETLKKGVALCKHCGAILDPERAAKFGLGVKTPGAKESATPDAEESLTPATDEAFREKGHTARK